MAKKPESLLAKARTWTKKEGLHGPTAFLRFIMMTFVERVNQVSDDFVFKGGNLLWIYIKTPRSTIDLDFSTRVLTNHSAVEEALRKVCLIDHDGLKFSLKSFAHVDRPDGIGAAVRIGYRTNEGQVNEFELDIVYALTALVRKLPSPLNHGVKIMAAAVENIVADKLSAARKFMGGNTRMKDFDDLWRLAQVKPGLIDWKILAELLQNREIRPNLDSAWINADLTQSWAAHIADNPGLPTEIRSLMNEVNEWLKNGLPSM